MKPVVVTGAAGFVGRRVVRRLMECGADVLAVDCVPLPSEWPPNRCWQVSAAPNEFRLPEDWVRPSQGFCLVHLAWNLDRERHSFCAEAQNVVLLASMLERCQDRGLLRLVALGSAAEYAQREGLLCEHECAQGLYSAYGWAKHCAFELARSAALQKGFPLFWLRPFIIYGPGQKGDMLIPYAVRSAAQGAEASFSDGEQQRDFVFVDDVVDAILQAITVETAGICVANLGSGLPIRIRHVLDEIAGFFPSRAKFHFSTRPRRMGEPEIQYADVGQARSLLGWTAHTDLRDGLRRTCAAQVEGAA